MLRGRGNGHAVAEGLELVDEFAGALLVGQAPMGPVRSEFAVVDAVVDDVSVSEKDVESGGADRLRQSADLGVVRGDVGALGP